ncbi:MAG: PepSY domain-containing protein [Candidatus Marinimicrobia bacterium]|nr:PepSY domain-containing protein [Candidatus Neomarinimicrobiota bacterium]
MSLAGRKKLIRTWHRRLGPIIGIQLFLWSLGGLYFSWVRMAEVRGEAEIACLEPENLKYENFLALIPEIIRNSDLPTVREIRLGKLLNVPVYRFIMDDQRAETYDAITGDRISPINRTTAIKVARHDFLPDAELRSVHRIKEHSGKYQGPIPAWCVTFEHWKAPAIYISVHTGEVTARRNVLWRVYDFLWRLHILDFDTGQDFNNWLIRLMSLLGLATIGSGYYLWYLTSLPTGTKRKKTGRKH